MFQESSINEGAVPVLGAPVAVSETGTRSETGFGFRTAPVSHSPTIPAPAIPPTHTHTHTDSFV